MSLLEFRIAIRDAIAEEIERDERVIFIGEDIAAAGGVFKATPGLLERFGPERVIDTPISELALAGAAFGAAVTGLRPIIEIMFGDFMALPMDSLVNQSAKYWYISNEQASIPLVVRSAVGGGGRFGAMHSQIHATWFQGIPGLKIAMPPRPAEAKGLLKGAIRDDNPVIFLEHKRLYSVKDEVPDTIDAIAARPGAGSRARAPTSRSSSSARACATRSPPPSSSRARARRRGDRPAHAAPARPRDRAHVGREDQPAARRRRGPAHRRLGRPACSERSPSRACTTSTTPGSSPPARRRSPTPPRSRTRSCRTRTPSSTASARGWAWSSRAGPRNRPAACTTRPPTNVRSDESFLIRSSGHLEVVVVEHDEVGQLALLDRAEVLVVAGQVGAAARVHAQRLQPRDLLARVGDRAGVVAAGDHVVDDQPRVLGGDVGRVGARADGQPEIKAVRHGDPPLADV